MSGDESVVVVGSGLTALDTLHVLHRRNHRGTVTLVAPEGLLPPVQTDWHGADALAWPDSMRASDFFGFMRRHIGDGDWHETEWQRRFESLRVDICAAWQRLSPLDKARLMRRVGWLWSLARFRAGPQAHGSAEALLASGSLTVRRDMVSGITSDGNARHHVRLASGETVEADFVVNCSGAGRDRLVSHLIETSIAAPHAGFRGRPALTADLALLRPDGSPYGTLHALGPVTAHEAGDVVGAPGTATQAHELAARLAASMPRRAVSQLSRAGKTRQDKDEEGFVMAIQQKLIIDTDPGQDDAVAILLALASPEIDLLGITTVAGNVPLALTEVNARKICDLAGRRDMPVFAGADRPLQRDLVTAEHVHGRTGLDGPDLPDPVTPLQDRHAVDFIVETLRAEPPGSITIAPVGPLTNIALALRKAPDIALRIKQIVMMGRLFRRWQHHAGRRIQHLCRS